MVRRTLIAVPILLLAPALAHAGAPRDEWPRIDDELLGGHGDDVLIGRRSRDVVHVRRTQNEKVKRRNCERVLHRSAKDAVNDRDGLYV